MVDVWLIFAQVVPWIEVLLHTLIDWMRTDEGERQVNHHGRTITVGGGKGKQKKEKVSGKQGYIIRGTCSYPELTSCHVLTSAYVINLLSRHEKCRK